MTETTETTLCEHGRPPGDCPLCGGGEAFDDVLVDVEAWAETVLAELDAELLAGLRR